MTRALLNTLIVLLSGTLVAEGPVASAEANVLPATDVQFAALAEGCWVRDTSVGSSTVCLDVSGKAYFLAYNTLGRDGIATAGRFRVLDGKVRLEGSGDAWPFERSVITCDAVVDPNKELALVQCEGAGELVGGLIGEPQVHSVSDSRWQFQSSRASCDWCEMAGFE